MESASNVKCQKAIHNRLMVMLGKEKYGSITEDALNSENLDFKNLSGYSIIPVTLIYHYMDDREKTMTHNYLHRFNKNLRGEDDECIERTVFVVLDFDVSDNEKDEDYARFKDASYICIMLCPRSFPQKPPELSSVTPNGYYAKDSNGEEGSIICISIGAFHSESYPTSVGITGFSYATHDMFFNCEKIMSNGGIGHIHKSSDELKDKLATNSRQWNIDNFPTVIKAQHYLYRGVPTCYGYDFDVDLYRSSELEDKLTNMKMGDEIKKKKDLKSLKRRR